MLTYADVMADSAKALASHGRDGQDEAAVTSRQVTIISATTVL